MVDPRAAKDCPNPVSTLKSRKEKNWIITRDSLGRIIEVLKLLPDLPLIPKRIKEFPSRMASQFYDALDSDSVRGFRKALKLVDLFGFQSLSSPIVGFLDAGIDFALDVLSELRKDPLEQTPQIINKTVKFYLDDPDELGNPRSELAIDKQAQQRLRKAKNLYKDPDAQLFFQSLATFFVRYKRGESVKDSFAESFQDLIALVSPKVGAPFKDKKRTPVATKVAAYHRRQRYTTKKTKTIKD
jgi:hypothetical protein